MATIQKFMISQGPSELGFICALFRREKVRFRLGPVIEGKWYDGETKNNHLRFYGYAEIQSLTNLESSSRSPDLSDVCDISTNNGSRIVELGITGKVKLPQRSGFYKFTANFNTVDRSGQMDVDVED